VLSTEKIQDVLDLDRACREMEVHLNA
jgi:hypothetical protein